MLSQPASYSHLLTFLLPEGARADSAVLKDSPYRCFVDFTARRLVSVMGPSRDAVFDQAARILREACRGLPAQCIAGAVYHNQHVGTPGDGRDWLRLPGPADHWSIIVNAEVAFSPTGLGHTIPNLARPARSSAPAPQAASSR